MELPNLFILKLRGTPLLCLVKIKNNLNKDIKRLNTHLVLFLYITFLISTISIRKQQKIDNLYTIVL